jgi:hypothetical protein
MRKAGRRVLVWLLPLAFLGACVPTVAQAITYPHLYTISGRRYVEANITVARYIPGLPSGVKAALSLMAKCPSLNVDLFVSTSHLSGGAVAYGPRSFSGCHSVVGGGPGGPSSFSPCFSFIHTTDAEFPYAAIVGSNIQTCIDLAFEVPGGLEVTLETEQGPQRFLVKAQHYEDGSLFDYVASPPTAIPSSQTTYRLYDSDVGLGPRREIPLF